MMQRAAGSWSISQVRAGWQHFNMLSAYEIAGSFAVEAALARCTYVCTT